MPFGGPDGLALAPELNPPICDPHHHFWGGYLSSFLCQVHSCHSDCVAPSPTIDNIWCIDGVNQELLASTNWTHGTPLLIDYFRKP